MAKTTLLTPPENAFKLPLECPRLGEFDLVSVLYHANYFNLYELAREAFLKEIGFPYHDFVKRSEHLAIQETHQTFASPVYYGEKLTLSLWLNELKRSSFVFHYSIADTTTNQTLNQAWTRHVFVSEIAGEFSVKSLPKDLKQALEHYS